MLLRIFICAALLAFSTPAALADELLHPREQDFETELLPGRWEAFTWGNTRDSGAYPRIIGGGSEHVSGEPVQISLAPGAPSGWGTRSLTIVDNDPIPLALRSHVGGVRITVPVVPGEAYTFGAHIQYALDESAWQYGAGMTVDANGGTDPRNATHGIKGNSNLLVPSEGMVPGDAAWNEELGYNNEEVWFATDEFQITATAQSDHMTLYLWALAKFEDDTRVQFDGVTIQGPAAGTVPEPDVADTLPIASLRPGATEVGLYEPWSVGFDLAFDYANPYDPRDIQVDFEFTGPSGETRTIPAFYTAASPAWEARIVPLETGPHTGRIVATDSQGRTGVLEVEFTAVPSDARGFVRQDPRNHYHLRFTNGEPYNAIGHNTCWVVGEPQHLTYLAEMAGVGENWTRFWMSALVGTGIEWGVGVDPAHDDLGTYDPAQVADYERGLDFCRDNGIYAQVCLDSFNEWHDNPQFFPFWDPSPYNAANGGPLQTPIEYLSNAEAKRLAKQRYRYVVARWAAHASVLCWELFNEVDAVGSGFPWEDTYHSNRTLGANWHREMAQYIQSIDPFDHPVTTSFAFNSPQWSEIWSLEEIGIVELHGYVGSVPGNHINDILAVRSFNKPIIYGEGNINGIPDSKPSKDFRFVGLFPENKDLRPKWQDLSGQSLHDQVWGTIMVNACAMSWWWDGWIHPNNLYRRIEPAVQFLEGEDWAPYHLSPVNATVVSGHNVEVFGSASDEAAFLWVRSPSGGTVTGLRIRLPQVTAWELNIEIWDTNQGTILASGTTNGGPNFVLNVPPFTRDVAVKVKAVQQPEPNVHWMLR